MVLVAGCSPAKRSEPSTQPSPSVMTVPTTPKTTTTTNGDDSASEKVTDFDPAANDAENVALQEEEYPRFALALVGAESDQPGMRDRNPGADLGKQIEQVRTAEPSPQVSITSQTTSSETSLTPDVVAESTVRLYLPGVRRCYMDERKAHPSAQGRVTIRFRVNEAGRSKSHRVSGFSTDMDACLQERASMWRFAVPKDSNHNPTHAEYSLTLEFTS